MKRRKLNLRRETIRGILDPQGVVGASRVRCGPGTYADSCLDTCACSQGCHLPTYNYSCFEF